MMQADFLDFFPQFTAFAAAHPKVITEYLAQAHNVCSADRWEDMQDEGIRLYTAHKITMYLRTAAGSNIEATDAQLVAAGEAKGLKTNKSVGGVSVGISESTATVGVEGWNEFKLTEYGIQFMSKARLLFPMGVYVI